MGKRLPLTDQTIIAEKIINTFENLLMEYNINIPNDEKNDPDNNPTGEVSNIYGQDYYNLEIAILGILKDTGLISKANVEKINKKPKCKYCKDTKIVSIGPGIRGLKPCPYCGGNKDGR